MQRHVSLPSRYGSTCPQLPLLVLGTPESVPLFIAREQAHPAMSRTGCVSLASSRLRDLGSVHELQIVTLLQCNIENLEGM